MTLVAPGRFGAAGGMERTVSDEIAVDVAVIGAGIAGVGFAAAAIESFGKAFLLIPDCLIGWLAMPGSKQRLFNRISHTIVIEIRNAEEPEGVTYVKQEE